MACLIPRCPANYQPALAILCIPTDNAVLTERSNAMTARDGAVKLYQEKTPYPFLLS